MKLTDRFRLAFRAFQLSNPASANLPMGDLDALMSLAAFGTPTASGVPVSEESGTRQATVFACINIIGGDAASLGVSLLERLPGGGSKEITDHPVAQFLREPNPSMTWKQFRVAGWQRALSWGNEYSQIIHSGAEIHAYPIDANPDVMKVRVSGGVKSFEYKPGRGSPKTFRANEIIHSFSYTTNGYWGVSPIRWCMETIGHALALEIYGSRSFDDPIPRVTFERELDFKDETAIESFLERWRKKFSTFTGRGERAAVLPRGMKANVLRIPNNEAQFIEARKFSKEEIAQIFNMPMHRLQALDRATFSNIEHQDLGYSKYCLKPHLTGYEQALERVLLTADERRRFKIRHNMDSLLRGDFKTRMEGHQIAVAGGFRTPNEARSHENEAPLPGGDKLYMQMNMAPLEILADPPEQDEPDPQDEPPRSLRPLAERRTAAASRKRMATNFQAQIRRVATTVVGKYSAQVRAKAEELIQTGDVRRFLEWLESWSPEQKAAIASAMLPVFMALAEMIARQAATEVDLDEAPDVQEFVRAYAEKFAEHFDGTSRGQLTAVATEAEAEALQSVLGRLDEWEEGGPSGTTRAEKTAKRESLQLMNAITRLVFVSAGFGLVWVTFGKSCQFCNELNGARVRGNEHFVPPGGVVNPGDGSEPMPSRGIRHPPLHGGCDCGIAPG